MPAATERFHDALDELENEVRLAQTVLRRDLALLKQERKRKEAATKQQEAEKARLAAESRNAPVKEEPPVKMEKVSTPAPMVVVPTSEPAEVEEPEKVLKRDEEPTLPPPINTTAEPERDPLFDGTPTTANPHESEFDFDAMFGDAMDTSGDNNQGLMVDTSGDMHFNLDDANEGPSLLRGLEDFAKSGDDGTATQNTSIDIDLPMPDLPNLSTTTAEQPPTTTKAVESAVTELTADATKDAAADNDVMATLVADDLEDLFNMDEYEQNPENSSFDDAFFNFDN